MQGCVWLSVKSASCAEPSPTFRYMRLPISINKTRLTQPVSGQIYVQVMISNFQHETYRSDKQVFATLSQRGAKETFIGRLSEQIEWLSVVYLYLLNMADRIANENVRFIGQLSCLWEIHSLTSSLQGIHHTRDPRIGSRDNVTYKNSIMFYICRGRSTHSSVVFTPWIYLRTIVLLHCKSSSLNLPICE